MRQIVTSLPSEPISLDNAVSMFFNKAIIAYRCRTREPRKYSVALLAKSNASAITGPVPLYGFVRLDSIPSPLERNLTYSHVDVDSSISEAMANREVFCFETFEEMMDAIHANKF